MTDTATLTQLVQILGTQKTLRLLDVFKTDVQTRLAAIEAFLDGHVIVADVRLHAHSLKGLCLTYGAPEAGELARNLQDACDQGDEAEVRRLARRAVDTIPGEIEAVLADARDLAAQPPSQA